MKKSKEPGRLVKNLIYVFNSTVMIVPFFMSVVFALVYLFGGWERWDQSHDLSFYFEFVLNNRFFNIMLCFIALNVMIIFSRMAEKSENSMMIVLVILFFALVLRIIPIYLYRSQLKPFSDFYRIWEMAHDRLNGHIDYYKLFPTYLNFTLLIKQSLKLLGDKYENILYINAFVSSLTSVLVYFVSLEATKKINISILASALYAVMPANILYCCTITPEFLAIFFYLVSIFIYFKIKDHSGIAIKLAFYIVTGVMIGLGSAYKPFGIIIIIAIAMNELVCINLYESDSNISCRIVIILLSIFFLMGAYRVTKKVILYHTEKTYQIKLNEADSVPHFLLVGLNSEGEGQIHLGSMSRLYYKTYLENNLDVELAKNVTYDILGNDLNNHCNLIPSLIYRKMKWAWQDDCTPLRYYNMARGIDETKDLNFYALSAATLIHAGYLFLMLGGCIGCFVILKGKNVDSKTEVLLLIIFGYCCLVAISEAQSRYKCLIMPFICMICALGISEFYELICTKTKITKTGLVRNF